MNERLVAALADRYRIERELGAGGMATVYLAEDLRHKRRVALKVLKPELAAVLGAERFVQEITTTAALQHPHILPLFDSGEADGFLYYVMPFIDGETLRAKLDRETQLGVDEAVRLTTEIADALHYAHTQGVIHRDIKPENILLQNGRPMVADFGIALAVSAAAGGRMTETGLSLGTPHYMSPEQATAEKEITARSDQYSLASVLYEMLTGNPPHMGSSAQQIIMKIITEAPADVTALRKSVPEHVAAAVAQALEKLPADRFASTQAFAEALTDATFGTGRRAGAAVGGASNRNVVRLLALASGTLAIALGWSLATRSTTASVPLAKFDILSPAATFPAFAMNAAVSADGRTVLYVVQVNDSTTEIRRRSIDQLEDQSVPGTTGGTLPALAPDGVTLAFVRDGRVLTAPLAGGVPPTVIAEGDSPAWGDAGTLYFTRGSQVFRVARGGGTPELFATVPDGAVLQPRPLPGERGVLFAVRRGQSNGTRIAVVGPDGGEGREILDGTIAIFTPPGLIVYTKYDGTLLAAPFDPETAEVGPSTALISDVHVFASSHTSLAISASGDLFYITKPPPARQELVWVNRRGEATPVDSTWTGEFSNPVVSPDGRQLAVVHDGQLWIADLDGGSRRILTEVRSFNGRPAWSPTGDSVLIAGEAGLTTLRADGAGEVVRTLSGPDDVAAAQWTLDRAWLVYRTNLNVGATRSDIRAIRSGRDASPIDIVATPAAELAFSLSPDGRWLAYTSEESGRREVYVVGFPDPAAGRWRISPDGGTSVLWSRGGSELFYRTLDGRMMSVDVSTSPTFRPGEPRALFASPYVWGGLHRQYDLGPDDQRFLMIRWLSTPEDARRRMIYVQNFAEDLRQRVAR